MFRTCAARQSVAREQPDAVRWRAFLTSFLRCTSGPRAGLGVQVAPGEVSSDPAAGLRSPSPPSQEEEDAEPARAPAVPLLPRFLEKNMLLKFAKLPQISL